MRDSSLAVLVALALPACGASALGTEAEWPPLAKKWFERADASYRAGDIEDADYSVNNALKVDKDREEVRLLAARVALAELEYDRAIELLRGMTSSAARGTRSRALWYSGKIEAAADELEQLNADPEVRDTWAVEVAKLAHLGSGRKPFEISGALLAVTEMPQAGTWSFLVPVEINGSQALAMIATGTAEAAIDSSTGATSDWVSLRFGDRLEVRDVPAVAQDLSGISHQVNAPVKLLIGSNLLRHLNPTFDFGGSQFVVRSFEPPPPPSATTVKLTYVRGGGMLLRSPIGSEPTSPSISLLVDTSLSYPLALDSQGWSKAGVSAQSLTLISGSNSLRQGVLPNLTLGAFPIPQVPGVAGLPMGELEKKLEMNIDGMLGAGLLANFRVTLVDRGRTMWLEAGPMADGATAGGAGGGPSGSADASDQTAAPAGDTAAPAAKPVAPGKPAAKPAPVAKPAASDPK